MPRKARDEGSDPEKLAIGTRSVNGSTRLIMLLNPLKNTERPGNNSGQIAQTQNAAQTALEAGHTAKIIFSNYRELVKPADAAKWFGIEPEVPENVIQVPVAGVAVSA